MDVLATTGGIRVTNGQKAYFGRFDSTSCPIAWRWGSGDLGIRYPLANDDGWKLLVPAARRSLGVASYGVDYPLPRDENLLQKFSQSGGGIDTVNMRYCPPQGVSAIVKEGEMVR